MISPKEKQILDDASTEFQMARHNLAQAQGKVEQALDLIGDRYEVDLKSGEYQIDGSGEIKSRGADQLPEGSKSENKLLKG